MNRYPLYRLALLLFLLFSVNLYADNRSADELKVRITKGKGNVYQLLSNVSEQSGFLLIYDSQLIDNDKTIRITPGTYSLTEAIHKITGNDRICTKIVGNHMLLYIPQTVPEEEAPISKDNNNKKGYFTFEGALKDHLTGEPVVYGSIGVNGNACGTISNQNGEFRLVLPDSLIKTKVTISHIGYNSREVEASLLAGRHVVFYLDQKVIPLQEVVVRAVDPVKIIKEMMAKRSENYSKKPVYITSFYREGVEYKHNAGISEAVWQIYKTGFSDIMNNEQVKLLKMRKMSTIDESDTLIAKIKSSVNTCLLLDLTKNPPDFLLPETMNQYSFIHKDITTVDDRRVYVFSFEQKSLIIDPLFTGELYIDAENLALIKARFEINPAYVRKTKNVYVVKRSKDIDVTPQSIVYDVTYKPVDGIYYINHVRGDLNFRVRRKSRMLGSDMHVWFEMVNCKIDTTGVEKFSRDEKLATHEIFSETKFSYDKGFWGDLNVILPEEKLKEIIKNYNFSEK